MSSSDVLWLKVWETFAAIGFVIVIIGVVIEGVEHFKKFPRKEHGRKLQIEKIGWFLVVAGLAMEFLGDHAAKRISDKEDARLNKEAGDARKDASSAVERAAVVEKEAGRANERAANSESNNVSLKMQLVDMEINLQPRIITKKQLEKFIELLKDTPKCPVKVFIVGQDSETASYAGQIRQMLDEAGYGTGKPDDVLQFGNYWGSPIGDPAKENYSPFAFIFYGEPEKPIYWPGLRIDLSTNTGVVPTAYASHYVGAVPAILESAFLKIGIKPYFAARTNLPFLQKLGDWAIIIPQKF